MDLRIGIGNDVHKLEYGRKLILGGIVIPFEKGLKGHSDADALTHAIIDSLLGAACLPDIGTHFPDNDDTYKDISSLILLERVVQMLKIKDYEIINIDSVVSAQRPKLAPYIKSMREKLAACIGIAVSRINIKAKTGEGLGLVGREEGISTQAVCMIEKKGRIHIYENI